MWEDYVKSYCRTYALHMWLHMLVRRNVFHLMLPARIQSQVLKPVIYSFDIFKRKKMRRCHVVI